MKVKLSEKFPNQFLNTMTGTIIQPGEVTEVKDDDKEIIYYIQTGFLELVEGEVKIPPQPNKGVVVDLTDKENSVEVDEVKAQDDKPKEDSKKDNPTFQKNTSGEKTPTPKETETQKSMDTDKVKDEIKKD